MTPRVMICLMTYNCQPFSKRVVEALFNHTDEPFDLFLMDNGSEAPTQRWLDKLEPLRFVNGTTLTIIRNPVNIGITPGLIVLQDLRKPGQHMLRMDNDMLVPWDPSWLTTLVEILENNTESIRVIGYPSQPTKLFFDTFDPVIIGLTKPLTADGRRTVAAWKTIRLMGMPIHHSKLMDVFRYPTGMLPYGQGNEGAVAKFCEENGILSRYIRPQSFAEWLDTNDSVVAMVPEYLEYHNWKLEVHRCGISGKPWTPFKPTKVGEDAGPILIRPEVLVKGG